MTVKTNVQKGRDELKAKLAALQSESAIKEHLLATCDRHEVTPRMVHVYALYGSIGSINFEDGDLNTVVNLLEKFEPITGQYWKNGCAYFKPDTVVKEGDTFGSVYHHSGVILKCDNFGQTFEWYTQEGEHVIRISIGVSPWGCGGSRFNYKLTSIREDREPNMYGEGRLRGWEVSNPRALGNMTVKMAGGPGSSGHGYTLWDDLDTLLIELDQTINAED